MASSTRGGREANRHVHPEKANCGNTDRSLEGPREILWNKERKCPKLEANQQHIIFVKRRKVEEVTLGIKSPKL